VPGAVAAPDGAAPPVVELRGIEKRFGPVHAVRGVDLALRRGEIHGIVGENGAGKSTLMGVLHGFHQADAGTILVDGAPARIASSRDAIRLGIEMVHQHFMLVDDFTVLENVMLGAEGGALLARGAARARAGLRRLAEGYGLAVEPDARVWLDPQDMMGAMAAMSAGHSGHGMVEVPRARHARTEYGPNVDMRVDYPRANLDDPGAGLRKNGRRVLTYADLRTIGGSMDTRPPGRDIELHLTGNMERFVWSLDGVKLNDARPIHFLKDERLRITLVNDSTMAHPMHLHGMWSEIEDPGGGFVARKHTISVQPAQRVSFGVTADAPGRWAFHCHLLYHMGAGMFREVVVA